MKIKQALYEQCQDFVQARLNTIQTKISSVQESLLSETKSSAGDKHETGRALLHLEREKASQQLAEIQTTILILNNLKLPLSPTHVSIGCIVYTTNANYFIAISAGGLQYENDKYYAISANTPIAKLLLNKVVGDSISFRDNNFSITNIL